MFMDPGPKLEASGPMEQLAAKLPKTAGMLEMAVRGGGKVEGKYPNVLKIDKPEAEKIAKMLLAFLKHMELGNQAQFDQNLSRIICRDLEADNTTTMGGIVKYFDKLVKKPYFKSIYKPADGVPEHYKEFKKGLGTPVIKKA